jgi:peptidoglycan/LPS O-acetylase OafA/YrhL
MEKNTELEASQQYNKLLGLEVIRFISALSILVYHYQHFFFTLYKPTNFIKEQQPLYRFLSLFYDYGFCGVQVFLCISGFIFFWKYREKISSNTITYKKFFVLRFSRLYPLHLATLMLVLFLQAIYYYKKEYFFVYQNNDITHFICQLFLVSNWGIVRGFSFNGPSWSISVEVLIYCLFFLMLKKISKSFLINVAVIAICLLAKYLKVQSTIFDYLAFFYIGGLSAIAFKQIQGTKYAKQISYISLFILLTSPLLIYITNIYQQKHFTILFLMSYTPILLFFCAHRFRVKPLIQKTIEAAGNMTYSSYLIHFPLQLSIVIYFMVVEKEIPYYSELFFAGFMFTTLFASYYIYRFFELPTQNRIRKSWLSFLH